MFYRPGTVWASVFLAVVLVKVVVTTALTGCIVTIPYSNGEFLEQPEASITLFIGLLCQEVFAYSALSSGSMMQVAAFCLVSLHDLAYLLAGRFEVSFASCQPRRLPASPDHDDLSAQCKLVASYDTARLAFNGLCTGLEVCASLRLSKEFAWITHKTIGVYPQLKKPYIMFQIFLALLKVGVYGWLGNLLEIVFSTPQEQKVQFYSTIAAIAVTGLSIPGTFYAVREESIFATIVALVSHCALIGFFVAESITYHHSTVLGPQTSRYLHLGVFDIVSVVILTATSILTVLCARSFHKGLKPILRADRLAFNMEEKFQMELHSRERRSMASHSEGKSSFTLSSEGEGEQDRMATENEECVSHPVTDQSSSSN